MKSLYIVDYWVPFPQSEYGGVVNLIAGSDAEAFELCADDDQLAIPGMKIVSCLIYFVPKSFLF